MAKIKVYSTSTCPWCHKLKHYLDEKGIEYEDVDVSDNEEAVKEMTEKSGQMGVPQIEINGKMIVGFDQAAIEAELNKKRNKMYDIIIVGAGIAGLTAAMYAARKKMKYEIFSSDFGGQFMVSGEVLNYPGIVKTTGIEFATTMEEQMKFNNVKVKTETLKEIKKKGTNFQVVTGKNKYDTKTVLIATGARPRKLGVPGEDKFAKKGVTYCSICDGPLFSGKDVAIIGGGDAALEAVDFLKDIAKKIHLIVRDNKFKAHEYLQEKVNQNKKVNVLFNAKTTEVVGDKFVTGLKIEQDGKKKELKLQGVIIEIGRVPNTELFKNLVELDEHTHIKIDCQGHSSVPGIFAAGDCAGGHEYQYVIAAGQGCMALIKAARYLAAKKD